MITLLKESQNEDLQDFSGFLRVSKTHVFSQRVRNALLRASQLGAHGYILGLTDSPKNSEEGGEQNTRDRILKVN